MTGFREHKTPLQLLNVINLFRRPVPVLPGLQTTRLGTYIEDRVNKYLKRQNHPEAGSLSARRTQPGRPVAPPPALGVIIAGPRSFINGGVSGYLVHAHMLQTIIMFIQP